MKEVKDKETKKKQLRDGRNRKIGGERRVN
jgi:hypothetical protein